MNMRPLQPDDLGAVVALAERTCARFGPVGHWIPAWHCDGFARATVALDGRRLVGFSLCSPVAGQAWWECRLAAVALDARRGGIARALFVADQAAAAYVAHDILLTVAEDNAAIQGLVGNLGYMRVEVPTLLQYPDGSNARLMRWRPPDGSLDKQSSP